MRNKGVILTVKEERIIIHTIKTGKVNWIGHILRSNCFLKHVIEGDTDGKLGVKGRRGRRRKQLQGELKEKRGYCKFKEDALDHTLCITHFGRGCGPVVRQTTRLMNFNLLSCE
jgi:hypothetical protein